MLTIRYAWQRRNENKRYWPRVKKTHIFGKTFQLFNKGVGFWAKTLCWEICTFHDGCKQGIDTPIVESTYLNRDMCKFELSQKDESRWQSTDSSKAYRNTSAFKCVGKNTFSFAKVNL